MDDFAAKQGVPNMFGLIQGPANAIAPGKRPLSSMTPTIVLKDGKLRFVLGSPGGARIITTVANIFLSAAEENLQYPAGGRCAALPSSIPARQALPGAGLLGRHMAGLQALGYKLDGGEPDDGPGATANALPWIRAPGCWRADTTTGSSYGKAAGY